MCDWVSTPIRVYVHMWFIRANIITDCGGSGLCPHGKVKRYCKPCGGKGVCKAPLCETQATHKYKGHCLFYFVHLFPDEPVVCNYKTKECAVATYVKGKFPKLTWVQDKRIEGGSSRKRLDQFLDMGSHVVIVEVDENKHDEYDCTVKLGNSSRDL